MSHMPVDHPLRGLYRGIGVLTGAASAAYGAIALVQTSDHSFFDDGGERVLGMRANPAAGVVWIVIGLLALLTGLVGRNVDARTNFVLGPALWVLGTIGLMVIRTPNVNFLAFSITTVIVMYIVGGILLTSALYTRISGAAPARRPDSDRETVGVNH
jgi:hypothetical protein